MWRSWWGCPGCMLLMLRSLSLHRQTWPLLRLFCVDIRCVLQVGVSFQTARPGSSSLSFLNRLDVATAAFLFGIQYMRKKKKLCDRSVSCWTLVESTVYKVNWLNLGEPKVQVQLPWSQIYHFMTDTTYSSSGRRRMIHEPSSHSCIFWPINYSSPLVHSTYFSLATILLSFFFYVWLWSSWCMQGGSIHWRTKEDKMYVYGLWIWSHGLRIQFFSLPCDPRRQFERFCYSISYESPTLPQCSRTETEPGHQWVHAEWEWASVGLVRGNVIKFS